MSTAELVRSRHVSVVVVARPRAGTRVQFSAGRKRFFRYHNIQTLCGPHPDSYVSYVDRQLVTQ